MRIKPILIKNSGSDRPKDLQAHGLSEFSAQIICHMISSELTSVQGATEHMEERKKERKKKSFRFQQFGKCIHIYSKPNDGCLKNQSMQAKNLIFFCKIFDSCLFVGKQHTRTEIENYDTSSIVMFQRVKKRKTNCSSEDEVKKPKRLKFSFLHWEYSVIIDLLVCYSEHPSRITVLGKGTLICPKKTCPSKWS